MSEATRRKTEVDPSKRLLTKRQVADMFGVDTRTINRWMAAGKLKVVRINPTVVRFDQAAVERFRKACGGI